MIRLDSVVFSAGNWLPVDSVAPRQMVKTVGGRLSEEELIELGRGLAALVRMVRVSVHGQSQSDLAPDIREKYVGVTIMSRLVGTASHS